jgi:hypothetical protein
MAADLLERFKEVAKRNKPLGDLTTKDLINEGRRYL